MFGLAFLVWTPVDLFMRRFGWPRSDEDLIVLQKFHEALDALAQS